MTILHIRAARRDSNIEAEIKLLKDDREFSATSLFHFPWAAQDDEDLRWYLEDYPIYVHQPTMEIAKRIEKAIVQKGALLFQGLFPENSDARGLWKLASKRLEDLRIEIVTENSLTSIPWELLRESSTQITPAKSCQAFVRAHPHPARTWGTPEEPEQQIRILLVICRPKGGTDIPFRSVASHLARGLKAGFAGVVSLEVLRPPTYKQLTIALRKAAKEGRPYHIVHFDGHGFSGGVEFENPNRENNSELIDGDSLGSLLGDSRVPLVVLNACRSAFAQPRTEPLPARDIHEDLRSFGSLAMAVADQGVPAVVAMRFNVFVETAARFMLGFYNSLRSGATVGDALNSARRDLGADPVREALPVSLELEDWLVPIGYESGAVQLFAPSETKIQLQLGPAAVEPSRNSGLPRRPDIGFFGRDETLLALDRAFDEHNVVLLHAFAGSGKTTTAAEFARWYLQTGGIQGPALFTSFETHRTLPQVLDQLGRIFEKELAQAGRQWLAITDLGERRDIVLKVLRQVSVLWIWDNIEPVTGFPAGSVSAWDKSEQDQLADFLRDASEAGAKFLLTSRREEWPWLADLPVRITMPPMPFRERFQLANALATRLSRSIREIEDWRPLLEFTQGNPLTITVLVGEALRSNLRNGAEIQAFVSKLRVGMARIHDEAREGRSRSLAASLSYGLEHAFQPHERRLLALLALFQGYVNVQLFMYLGQGQFPIVEVKNTTELEVGRIFNTASELGILEKLSDFAYSIHPAVPWFFQGAFSVNFKDRELQCAECFCNVMTVTAASLSQQFGRQIQGVGMALYREEPNFLHAYELAVQWRRWHQAALLLHAIEDLYQLQGRQIEWKALVFRLHKLIVEPGTEQPIRGAEDAWPLTAEHLMRIAKSEYRLEEAKFYAAALVHHHRQKAAPYLSGERPLEEGHEEVHNLSVMVDALGSVKAQLGSLECLQDVEEGLALAEKIGDDIQAAMACFNMGYCYRDVVKIRNLNQAIEWYAKALEKSVPQNQAFRGQVLAAIGETYQGLLEELSSEDPDFRKRKAQLQDKAARAFILALQELPDFAVERRAEASVNLGAMFVNAGLSAEALPLLEEGLKLARAARDEKFIATGLYNLTAAFFNLRRDEDALVYAKAAIAAMPCLGPVGDRQQIELLDILQKIQSRANTYANAPSIEADRQGI